MDASTSAAEEPDYWLIYQHLLIDVRDIAEKLLASQLANVWRIFGGLKRFHAVVEKLFQHGCKGTATDESDYFNFAQGLDWLQPEHISASFSVDCEYRPHLPAHLKGRKSSIWLFRSLENHSLSLKLSWLLSDRSHVQSCYEPYAFLCQEEFTEATIIILRAVERGRGSLLAEINPHLVVLPNIHPGDSPKLHRRSSSFPDNHLKTIFEEKKRKHTKHLQEFNETYKVREEEKTKQMSVHGKLRPWFSMPSLTVETVKIREKTRAHSQSKTTPNTPIHCKKLSPNILKVDYNTVQSKTRKTNLKKAGPTTPREVKHVLINNRDIVEHTPPLSSSQSSGTLQNEDLLLSTKSLPETSGSVRNMAHSPRSMVESFLPQAGQKDYRKKPKKSFIEDGGMSVLPMATGYFPKPAKGQSLLSFLTSAQFARANAALDRENAHFSVSEAIISAMEQIRCRREAREEDDSDPEIAELRQRIRLRRREKAAERRRREWVGSLMSDGKTDTTTSVSPRSTTPDTSSASSSSDDVDDLEMEQASSTLRESSGLSMSMASLYSERDLRARPRGTPDGAASDAASAGADALSAEGVALSLISKFSQKQLPRASDLEWLVSEEDAPQALLPLPQSWPVSPDDSDDNITPLRGTQEWAPPRPQIIFTLHPAPSRKALMAKQNYRCAGCSMRVAPQYASRFRYCDYLGRYFCTGCHTNQLALIPGRVLQKWDFTRYPVSTFSYRLLEQMCTDPLFRVFELNKNISKMSKNLQFCRRYRLGLYYLKDFIFTCKYADTIKERLEQEMSYVLTDPEVYSMDDLVNVRSGEMKTKLKVLVEICCRHTSECKLCLVRGFICEVCNANEVIFPWQMRFVTRCNKCGTCYHNACWNPSQGPCKKCLRIRQRKESADSASSVP